jgi:hypothetical protein
MIYASPLTHMYVVKSLERGIMNQKDILALAAAKQRLQDLRYVFMPHNHHHHFHVSYGGRDGEVLSLEDRISHLESMMPLWTSLGIDFGPFIRATTGLKTADEVPEGIRLNIEREKNLVLAALAPLGKKQHGSDLLTSIMEQFKPQMLSLEKLYPLPGKLSPELEKMARNAARTISSLDVYSDYSRFMRLANYSDIEKLAQGTYVQGVLVSPY